MVPRARAVRYPSWLPAAPLAAASSSVRHRLLFASLAAIVLVAGVVLLDRVDAGPLTIMMGGHILLMNGVAPLLAAALVAAMRCPAGSARLGTATVMQVAALLAMHHPDVLRAAHAAPPFHLAMQLFLLAIALWFWTAVLALRGARRWRALVALALTGKLFCLLAALMVLAPRPLAFADMASHGGAGVMLEDQQLAGLLMLAACPLTYVLAGIVVAARWLVEMAGGEPGAGRGSVPGAMPAR